MGQFACAVSAMLQLTRRAISAVVLAASGTLPAQPVSAVDGLPLVRIAGDVGDLPVEDVHGVALLRRARLGLAIASQSRVVIVEHTGRLERSFGRRGQGPGEVTFLIEMLPVDSTRMLVRSSDGRTHLFRDDGRLLATVPRPQLGGGWVWVNTIGVDDAGRWVVVAARRSPGADTARYGVFLTTDSSAHQVSDFPGSVPVQVGGGRWRVPLFAAAGVAVVGAGRACFGYPGEATIRCVDLRTSAVVVLHPGFRPRLITPADVRVALEAELAGNTRDTARVHAAIRNDYRTRPVARHSPVFGTIRIASDSTVWVSEWYPQLGLIGRPADRAPQARLRWTVFGPRGTAVQQVMTPPRFLLTDINATHLAGIRYADNGAEEVVLLRRPRR